MLRLLLIAGALTQQPSGDHALCEGLVDGELRHNRTQIQSLLATQPGPARGAFLHGCLAMADTAWQRASDRFEAAVAQSPSNASYHMWAGRAQGELAMRGNPIRQMALARRIRDHFLRAVQLEPDNLSARRYLIEFYIQAPAIAGGSTTRAAEQIAEIRRRSPYLGGLNAAQLATRRNQHAVAEREYNALLTAFPDSMAPVVGLMSEYYRGRRWDAAAALIARMRQARPNSMLASYLTGRLAVESGRDLEAGEQGLRRYLTHTPRGDDPPLANAHWRLGQILQQRGDREGARREYQEALRLNPQLSGARESLNRLR